MFINLKSIQSCFYQYSSHLYESASSVCLTHFAYCHPNQKLFQAHILYLSEQLPDLTLLPKMDYIHFILCTNKHIELDQLPSNISILLVSDCTLDVAEQLLHDYFTINCGRALMSDSLLDILFSESGIQAMLDKVYPVFQNPIVVFDTGFKLIAANFDEIKGLSIATELIKHHGFSETEFQLANSSNIHKRAMKSPTPIRIFHEQIGFEQIICPINPKIDLGHIVLTASNHPFSEYDEDFLVILQKAIDQQLKKDEFIRNNRGFQYEYFLRDILDGKMAIPQKQSGLLDYASTNFGDKLYCMVVETAKSSNAFSTLHIRADIESCFPEAKTLLYHGEIIAIIPKKSDQIMSMEETEQLNTICTSHGLFAGLSNEFYSISKLPAYYTQALRAIEMGTSHKNQPSLFIYKNYYQDHLFHLFTQKESPDIFCHPKMRFLMEYDQEHQSELAKTLFTFLIKERNYSAAAKALFIHRNTFIYRMKKIDELLDIDYEDYSERQYLILSYEMKHLRE